MQKQMHINKLNENYHNRESFKEQLAVLYWAGIDNNQVKLIRSFVNVCQPGSASFSFDHPGQDLSDGWNWIDDQIENENVWGTFHTHPFAAVGFSEDDRLAYRGFAKTYGHKYLWHGVQACENSVAHFVCTHMIGGRAVIIYNYPPFYSDLDDPVILLPMPPALSLVDGAYVMRVPVEHREL